MWDGFSNRLFHPGVLFSGFGIMDLLKLDPQVTFITIVEEKEHFLALLFKRPVHRDLYHAFEFRPDLSLLRLGIISKELVAFGGLVKVFEIVIEPEHVVEAEMKGMADLASEFEEGNSFRYGKNAVRVTSHFPLAVALDDLKKKDPFTGLRLAPVHRDLVIRVCCSPHDLMVIRDTISACLFGCGDGSVDPDLRSHKRIFHRPCSPPNVLSHSSSGTRIQIRFNGNSALISSGILS